MPRKPAAKPQFDVVKVAAKKWQLTVNGRPEGEPYTTKRDADEARQMAEADYQPPAPKPAKAMAPKPDPVATAALDASDPTPEAIAAMTPTARIELAKAEAAAKRAAKAAGEPAPPTPVLDWMAGTPRPQRRTTGGAGAAKVRMDDTAVRSWIVAKRAEGVDVGPGKLLALFRSSGLSCSQERFRAIAGNTAS